MAQDRWIMVRVDRGTHAALCDVRASMLRSVERGQRVVDLDHTGHVSLDQVIVQLISERNRHIERASAANRRRRLRGYPPAAGSST